MIKSVSITLLSNIIDNVVVDKVTILIVQNILRHVAIGFARDLKQNKLRTISILPDESDMRCCLLLKHNTPFTMTRESVCDSFINVKAV